MVYFATYPLPSVPIGVVSRLRFMLLLYPFGDKYRWIEINYTCKGIINVWEMVVFCCITGNADYYKAEKVIENLTRRFSRALPKWFELIDHSFLPDDQKRQYKKSSCAAW